MTPDAIQRTIASKEKKFDGWRRDRTVSARWLLLTLSLEGERLLDGARRNEYTAAFDVVYCMDRREHGLARLAIRSTQPTPTS